jgi:hypothetical protein
VEEALERRRRTRSRSEQQGCDDEYSGAHRG